MLLVVALLLTAGAIQAPASQVDVTYLREMPTVDAVMTAIQGEGPLDTPARQGAAFQILKEMFYRHVGGRRYTNQLTPSERAMLARIDSGYVAAVGAIVRRYDPAQFQQTEALQTERARFYQLLYAHQADPKLRDELLTRFFSEPWRDNLEALVRQDAEAMAARSREEQERAARQLAEMERENEEVARRLAQGGSPMELDAGMQQWVTRASWGVVAVGIVLLLLTLLEFGPLMITLDGSPRLRVGRRNYGIHYAVGEVLDAKKWSETHVSSSGGGSSMTPDGYYTARPVTVTSTVVTRDEIFLRQRDGKEHAIQLSGVDLPTRVGHVLAAVWMIKKGKERGPYVMFHNYSMDDTRFVDSGLNSVLAMRKWPVLPLGLAAGLATENWGDGVLAVLAYLVVCWVVRRGRVARTRKALNEWAKTALAQEAGTGGVVAARG